MPGSHPNPVHGDVTDPASLSAAVRGCQVIIHAAASGGSSARTKAGHCSNHAALDTSTASFVQAVRSGHMRLIDGGRHGIVATNSGVLVSGWLPAGYVSWMITPSPGARRSGFSSRGGAGWLAAERVESTISEPAGSR